MRIPKPAAPEGTSASAGEQPTGIARGGCTRCGDNPAEPNRHPCGACLEIRRASDRARYANARATGLKYGDRNVAVRRRSGRVANLSTATDESYLNKQTGERVDKIEWHGIVTSQDGLITMLEKHARKGRLAYIDGKLQTRRLKKDDEKSDRYATEVLLVPSGRVQFLDRTNGKGASNGQKSQPEV